MSLFRRLLTLAIVAMLAMPLGFALAQDASSPVSATGDETAFASGLGEPATLFDERGNPTSSIVVTDIVMDWADYDQYSAPPTGMMYVLVTIEHTNHGNRPMDVQPQSINLVDSMGLLAQFTWFGSSEIITMEPVSVEPGGVGITTTAYAVWADSTPMMVMYQPVYNIYGFVYLPPE